MARGFERDLPALQKLMRDHGFLRSGGNKHECDQTRFLREGGAIPGCAACRCSQRMRRVAAATSPSSGGLTSAAVALVGPPRRPHPRGDGNPRPARYLLIGAVNGGVWKTTDAGRTWNPIFDAPPTQSIGAIAGGALNPRSFTSRAEKAHAPRSLGRRWHLSLARRGCHWSHLGLRTPSRFRSSRWTQRPQPSVRRGARGIRSVRVRARDIRIHRWRQKLEPRALCQR